MNIRVTQIVKTNHGRDIQTIEYYNVYRIFHDEQSEEYQNTITIVYEKNGEHCRATWDLNTLQIDEIDPYE